MKKVSPVARLKNDILLLEAEQANKEKQLKEQFFITYESFKPAKLLGSTLKEMVSSPYMIDNIIDTSISLATGYIAKKFVVGASGNIIRRLLGTVLQYGVTNLVAKNAESIKSLGQLAFKQFFRKKETNTDKV